MATVVKEDADSDDEDETSLAVGLLASARDTKVASLLFLSFFSFPFPRPAWARPSNLHQGAWTWKQKPGAARPH